MWANRERKQALAGRRKSTTSPFVPTGDMAETSNRRRVKRAKRIPLGSQVDVTRAEFNRVVEILNERGAILNDLRHNQEIQFRRIAQIQAELDEIKRAWERVRLTT